MLAPCNSQSGGARAGIRRGGDEGSPIGVKSARPIVMKALFRKSDGRFLGAQALGEDGVDKRISALAMALQQS